MGFDMNEQIGNLQTVGFDNPADMFGEAVRRFAGQPFPGKMQAVKDALFGGAINFEDESGSVSLTKQGGLRIRPKTSNMNLSLDPVNKSVMVGYDSRQTDQLQEQAGFTPVEPFAPSAGRKYADEVNRTYQDENPGWYRY